MANVIGSKAPTLKSIARKARLVMIPSTRPIAVPIRTSFAARPRTSRRTSRRCAPRAIRTPISWVRARPGTTSRRKFPPKPEPGRPPAKTPIRTTERRRGAIESAATCSRVRTLAAGRSGSSRLISRRIAEVSERGFCALRTARIIPRYGRWLCAKSYSGFGSRSRRRCRMSPTTPTIVSHFTSGLRVSLKVIRLPNASWFGNHFFAKELLTVAIAGTVELIAVIKKAALQKGHLEDREIFRSNVADFLVREDLFRSGIATFDSERAVAIRPAQGQDGGKRRGFDAAATPSLAGWLHIEVGDRFAARIFQQRQRDLHVSTFFGSKPGCTFCSRTKLLSNKLAPTRRTRASATSAMTSALRRRLRRRPLVEPRPPSLSASVNSGLPLARAGISPITMPVATAVIRVKNRTRRSRLTSAAAARSGPRSA